MATASSIILDDRVRGVVREVPRLSLGESWRSIVVDGQPRDVAKWILSGAGTHRRMTALDADGKLLETRVGELR